MPAPLEYRMTSFPPSLSLLREIEEQAGFPLPAEIRSHFISHNGGEVSRSTIDANRSVEGQRDYYQLLFSKASVRGIKRPDATGLTVLSLAFEANRTFCVVLGPRDVGAIVEVEWFPDSPCQMIRRVANNFQEFQDQLLPDPSDEWNPRPGYKGMTWSERSYVDFAPYLPDQTTLKQRRGPKAPPHLECVECMPPVTDEHFAWIEQGFHIRVPLDIREHFQRFNGATSRKPLVYLVKGSTYRFHRFLTMQHPVPQGDDGMTDLGDFEARCSDWKWRDKIIPAHLYPVVLADDILCFSSREQDFGSIWRFMSHVYEQGFEKLADSFNEFLDMLVEDTRRQE